jgi:hypothetical protein
MGISEPSKVVEFDAEAALAAGREAVGEALLTCVEYEKEKANPMFIRDQVLAMYDGRDHMQAHFENIQEYFHVDLSEKELMQRELSPAGKVRYFVTEMEMASMVRIQSPEKYAGIWVTLAPGAPVSEVADEMYEAGFPERESGTSPYM